MVAVCKLPLCSCAAGWMYAEITTEDTLALRGLSLQLQSIQAHLEAARIEEHLDLRPSLRFPHFYEVPSHSLMLYEPRGNEHLYISLKYHQYMNILYI